MKWSTTLFFIPFLCFLVSYFAISYIVTPAGFAMPNLVGLSLQESMTILAPLQVNVRLTTEQEHTDIPAGTVLGQIPTAQQTIVPYQTVFITISKQPPLIALPNFHGLPLHTIQDTCTKNGWTLKTAYLESTQPYNQCIAQVPAPGTPADKQILVYLAQSSNQKPVIMPWLCGYRVPKVLDFLQQHGLNATIIHDYSRGSSHHCSCRVQEQRPLAGSLVQLDTIGTVQLYVQ